MPTDGDFTGGREEAPAGATKGRRATPPRARPTGPPAPPALQAPGDVVLAPAVSGAARGFLLQRSAGDRLFCAEEDWRELQASLTQAPSVLACGARGVDLLKRLLIIGGHELAWYVELHDIGLMRNALEGVSPEEAGRPSANPSGSACEACVHEARSNWQRLLIHHGAMSTYALAIRAQLMVAVMEAAGVPFNHAGLTTLTRQWRAELASPDVQGDTSQRAPSVSALNPRSNLQVANTVMREASLEELRAWPRTPSGVLRTDSATLLRFRLPSARRIIRYRELQHAISHYEPYGPAAAAAGGRLFPTYKLCGAVTGRMSCANPNLHSMPSDPAFRTLVAARPGGRLVKGDFSQVELRVLAEVSGDTRMRRAFASGQDLHCITAAALLGISEDAVTKEERQLAKAVNFGLIYGQSAAGLQQHAQASYGVAMTLEEAECARRAFFDAFPGVASWQKEQRGRARRGAVPVTPSGRTVHHLRATWQDANVDAARADQVLGRLEREALNFPIQGGAAEVMLACLDRLRDCLGPSPLRLLAGSGNGLCSADADGCLCRLVCVVHDEFLLECADAEAAEEAAAKLAWAMAEAWAQVFPRAACLGKRGASIAVGATWGELRPWPDAAVEASNSRKF